MRLIHTTTLEQHEFPESDIPMYAILSHTWGDEEVSYEDYVNGKRDKRGFSKIEHLCTQAKSDGIEYAWIDTACIQKSSSSELSEAINSMMKWYEDAEICYAYLEDVESDNVETFETARWFRRGWCLQELIAPFAVQFYGKGWKHLGSRATLSEWISKITGIDVLALNTQKHFRFFSIATRMSWAARRKCTRTEDLAYCLLGIFDINMPILYGEGSNAFIRLQQEIIRTSSDESILAWDCRNAMDRIGLAQHPSYFEAEYRVIPLKPSKDHRPYVLTNRGLQMHLPLVEDLRPWGKETWGVLNCRFERCFEGYVAIPLEESDSPDTFYRKANLTPITLSEERVQRTQYRIIYLDVSSKSVAAAELKRSICMFRMEELQDSGYEISHREPEDAPGSWNSRTFTSEIAFSPADTIKSVIRSFQIWNSEDNTAFVITLVTGYFQAEAKLFVEQMDGTQKPAARVPSTGYVFDSTKCDFASDRTHVLKVASTDRSGRTSAAKIKIDLKLEEMLQTKDSASVFQPNWIDDELNVYISSNTLDLYINNTHTPPPPKDAIASAIMVYFP